MKKLLWLLTILTICVSLVACDKNDDLTDENDVVTDEQPAEDETETEIEIKIDYVAEQLGLTDESEVYFHLIGAVAGKQYNRGNIELYQFDENSNAYKDIISGKTYLPVAAYKDGVVLVFALGVEQDADIVAAFNALEF